MKRSIKTILSVGCIIAMCAVGCKKQETVQVDNETQSSVDNAVADQEYASIVPTVNNHAINTKGTGAAGKFSSSATSPCDTLFWVNRGTADTNTNITPNKYNIAPIYELNLASSCPSSFTDGKLRSGKWSIRITGPLKIPGNQMIIKLVNHKTGTIGYSCDSMVITTIATSTLSSTYNIKLINGVCSSPNWVIKYSSDRTVTHYVKGNPVTASPYNSLTEVYGTANGINRSNKAFTVNIPSSTPLVKHKNCQFIEKGIMTLTPEGFKERIVDFGYSTVNTPNGCDDDASFTVNGNTVAFKLK